MSVGEFLGRLSRILDDAGIPWMVAGSVASAFHGMPRSTQDIDIVVDVNAESLEALLKALPDEDYYVSETAAVDALRRRRQFNVIDMATGWKADLIVRKDRAFSRGELSRRQRATILDVEVWVASAEDVVLTKLEWAKRSGGSERQLRDVAGVLRGQDELDWPYLERWAEELGLKSLLEQARSFDG